MGTPLILHMNISSIVPNIAIQPMKTVVYVLCGSKESFLKSEMSSGSPQIGLQFLLAKKIVLKLGV